MTLVEKIARALATADWRRGVDEFKEPNEWAAAHEAYDLTNNNGRFHYDELARAAIQAMRELTPATLEATVSAFNDYESAFETSEETVTRILGSLIDAAIKEAEGE